MVYKVPTPASPFVTSDVKLVKSSFKNSLVIGSITKGSAADLGGGSGFTSREALQSSMGEYIERLTQRKPSHLIKNPFLDAFNINTEDNEKIPLEDILLFEPSVFNSNVKSQWGDSTGTAFHRDTISVIESSYFEFIERQSLVFSWLTQSPGKKLDKEYLKKNEKLNKLTSSLNTYFHTFDLFEISIHSGCFVVITIGVGDYCKSIGIGVGWDLASAAYKSMKETLQCISNLIPSHQPEINPEMLDAFAGISMNPSDMYYEEYFDNLSPIEFQNEFLYLYSKNVNLNLQDDSRDRPSDKEFIPFLKQVATDLHIEILLCYIPSLISNIPGVVTRLIGKGAFPHIKTDELEPSIYTINGIDKFSLIDLPNYKRMVPFN